MENFKIGDSDELVTVTRSKWDEMKTDIEESDMKVREMNKNNTVFFAHKLSHSHIDQFISFPDMVSVVTNDEVLAKLMKSVEEMERSQHGHEGTIRTLKHDAESRDSLRSSMKIALDRLLIKSNIFNRKRKIRNLIKTLLP